MKVCIIGEFEIKEGQFEAFTELMREHSRICREVERGCLQFEVIHVTDEQGNTDRSKVILFEVYKDEEAAQAHSTAPRQAGIRERYLPLVGKRRRILGPIVT